MLNWLYGPRIDLAFPGYIVLRSLRLDIDAVRDVYRIVNEKSGPAVLSVAHAQGFDPIGALAGVLLERWFG